MCIHATHTTPFFPLLSSLSYLVILTSFRLLTCHHVQFGATDAELQGLSLAEDDRPPPLPFGIPGAFSPEFKDEEAAAVAAARPPPLPFDDPGVMPAAKPSTPRRRSADGKLQVKGIVMHCALSLCEGHLHFLVLLASDCAHTITVCLPIINLTCHKHTHHYTYVITLCRDKYHANRVSRCIQGRAAKKKAVGCPYFRGQNILAKLRSGRRLTRRRNGLLNPKCHTTVHYVPLRGLFITPRNLQYPYMYVLPFA